MSNNTESIKPMVTIYTDGSWLRKQSSGGWSAMMTCGPHWMLIYDGIMNTTVNRMELSAAIIGLERLTIPCEVEIVADSQLTCNIINGWIFHWKRNGFITKQKKPVCNQDLLEQLYPLLLTHDVKATWTRAHTDNQDPNSLGNAIVDVFARGAAYQTKRNETSRTYLQNKMPRCKFK